MTWQWTPYALPLFAAAAISLVAAGLVFWHRRHIARSRVGALLLLAASAWMFGSALELSSVELAAKVVWDKLQFVGICIIPSAWLAYALRYTGRERHMTLHTQILLSIVPLVTFLLVITNEAHGLIWQGEWLDTSGPLTVKRSIHGVWLWVFTAYSYVLILAGLGLLLGTLVRAGRLHRWQAGALLGVVVVAWTVNLAEHVFGWTGFHDIELTPFALAVTAPILAWAFYRLKRRGVVPVARDAVVEGMADALLVLDAENRIVDLNPSAQELLGGDRMEILGRGVQQFWPQWPDWTEGLGGGQGGGREIAVQLGGGQRVFDLHVSPLLDWRSDVVGQVVVCGDITERLQAEGRLRASLQEKEMLLETSAALTASLDLGSVLISLADQLLGVSGFSMCSIYDWGRETGTLQTLAEHSQAIWPADHREVFLLADFPTTERVLTTGEPEVVHLGMDDPELIWMREAGLAAVLLLPLYAGEETIGLVEIGSTHSESVFTESRLLRCGEHLQEAARGLVAPFRANEGGVLLNLARELTELSGGSSCSISEWGPSKAEVRTAAEYSRMTWLLGQGPVWELAGWPSGTRVLATGCPLVTRISDPDAEPADREDLLLYRARTLAFLPILMKGEPIGLVDLYDVREERDVDDGELRLWQGVVNQAAVAIENARLHARVRKQLEVEAALREAGTVFSSTLEPDAVLNRIVEQMARAIDATSAYICGFDSATMQSAVLAQYIGPAACTREQVSNLGASYHEEEMVWLRALAGGQHHVSCVDDADLPEVERKHMQRHGALSILYVPLLIRGQIVGFVELWESRRRREFTKDEVTLCHAIAQNAAVALENARLYGQIRSSLQEKDVLLQEIHHRVKNNLQVISSLLNLQANTLEDPQAAGALRDSQDRVRSMALVHEKLYESPNLAEINFADYMRALTRALFSSYNAPARGIALHTETDDVFLSIDKAIPCGLILSELVSNALKHAFPGRRSGEIAVGLGVRNGGTVLTVSDDGIGLPKRVDMSHPDSLGLQLVGTLTTQLDGTLTLSREKGTRFTVTFPSVR